MLLTVRCGDKIFTSFFPKEKDCDMFSISFKFSFFLLSGGGCRSFDAQVTG